jgi:FKBP-type peptidyl-prolyl cis-trans isomerase FkpA
MKRIVSLALLACALFITPSFGQSEKILIEETKDVDTLSYCIGVDVGQSVKHQFEGLNLKVEELENGIKGALNRNSHISNDNALSMLEHFFDVTVTERQAKFQKEQERNPNALFRVFESVEEEGRILYALGVNIGANLLNMELDIRHHWLLKGVGDGYNGTQQLKNEQISEFMNRYFTVVLPAEAKRRSEEWLAAKERESGVQKSESGLLYKVVVAGDMERAAKSDDDTVVVHYVGRRHNGKVFDSSRFELRSEEQKRAMRKSYPSMFDTNGKPVNEDKPLEFALNRVISGWTEGMKLVGPGGKILLYIPSNMAYGVQGAQAAGIGPNEALEFEVELLDVKPAK